MSKLNSKIRKITSIPLSIAFKKVINSLFKSFLAKRDENHLRQINETISGKILISNTFFEIPIYEYIFLKNRKVNFKEEYINQILNHDFDILGSGLISVNKTPSDDNVKNEYSEIDWHQDFKIKYNWSSEIESSKIKIGYDRGVDIKVPWELARFNHLPELALCSGLNPNYNIKILSEIYNELNDFIENNPFRKGIHWISPMEVSIRAINIILTLSILKSKNVEISSELLEKVSNYLYISGIFINNKLEWSEGLRNNHYFANIVGLLYISSCFQNDRMFQQIFKFSISEFQKEILYQFNCDGSNFEGSLPYHFFMLEMIYIGSELLRFTKKMKISEKFKKKIYSILSFSKNVFYQEKFYSQVGDNDSGIILNINNIVNINDINNYHFEIINSLTNLFKNDSKDNIRIKQLSNRYKQYIYKDIGLFIYESNFYKIIISLGRKAQNGKGGHNHLDSTSFVLYANGKEIFTDPGTFVYTSYPDKRNEFRSSKSHNCYYHPSMDTFQSENPEDLFWLEDARVYFSIDERQDIVEISIYKKIGKFEIKRNFVLQDNEIQIKDIIPEELRDDGIISFHFAQTLSIEPEIVENSIILDNQITLTSGNPLSIENYDYSPEYGKLLPAKVAIARQISQINHFQIKMNYQI